MTLAALGIFLIVALLWAVIVDYRVYHWLRSRHTSAPQAKPERADHVALVVLRRVCDLPAPIASAWARCLIAHGKAKAALPKPRWTWVESAAPCEQEQKTRAPCNSLAICRGTLTFFGIDGTRQWVIDPSQHTRDGYPAVVGRYLLGDAYISELPNGELLLRSASPELPAEARFLSLAHFLLFAYVWNLCTHCLRGSDRVGDQPQAASDRVCMRGENASKPR